MSIIVPPKEIFEIKPQPPIERAAQSGYDIPGFIKATRSQDGEMLSYFEGFPLPRKGLVYAEAVMANNEVKRRTLTLIVPFACKEFSLAALGFALTPYKWKIKFLEGYLQNYIREVDSIYFRCERVPYLKKEYYDNFSKAIWDVVETLLVELGISQLTARKIGQIVATIFQFDDAYKIRAEDLFSETAQDYFLKHTRKEIKRLLEIYTIRENPAFNKQGFGKDYILGSGIGERVKKISSLFSLLLLHPKFKRAIKMAFTKVNFKWLQLDDYEVFWNLNRSDYDLLGVDFEKRMECFKQNIESYKLSLTKC